MKMLLAIGAGSFIGGIMRFLLSKYIQSGLISAFPYGTLVVNVTGCFVIGIIAALSSRGYMSQQWQMFLATGICGGFTTFSAFSNETMALLRNEQYLFAMLYISVSVLLGLLATFAGIAVIRTIT